MSNEIKEKLIMALDKELDEAQVIYILSRIRKIIEIKKLRKIYKILNIYCNWSLHSRIDNTEDIKVILKEFVNNAEARKHLLYLSDFKAQFKRFVDKILSKDINDLYVRHFTQILTNIISDTPISFKTSKLISITINPSHLPRKENEITYTIVESEL